MRTDLAAKMGIAPKRVITPKTGVAGVAAHAKRLNYDMFSRYAPETVKTARHVAGAAAPPATETPHVAALPSYVSKSLKLQQLRPLRLQNDKIPNDATRDATTHLITSDERDEVEIEERKAMAAGGVPEPYLDAWARLQCQRPVTVSADEWRQAIVDAGLFLDCWGTLALELGWTASDLFDAPSNGDPGGLVWRIRGEGVRSLGCNLLPS